MHKSPFFLHFQFFDHTGWKVDEEVPMVRWRRRLAFTTSARELEGEFGKTKETAKPRYSSNSAR